jgi:hypothetical protein
MINGNIKKPTILKGTLLGWANLVFAEVLSLLVCFFTAMFMSSNIAKGIVGLCTMVILVCIIGNYAYKCAKNSKGYERINNTPHDKTYSNIVSVMVSLPLILQWLLLVVFKASQNYTTGNTIFVVYRFLNAYYLPWLNVFCPTPELEALPIMGLVTLLALTIIPAIAFNVAYNITYHNIDVEKILLYNRE